MKRKLMLMLLALSAMSCKKNLVTEVDLSANKNVNLETQVFMANTIAQLQSGNYVNVKDYGALGNADHDDTQAIQNAMLFARNNGKSTVYFPEGIYMISSDSNQPGIIKLLNGVSLLGDGPERSKIKLSGGRFNPKALFYQAWWEDPEVSNLKISNLDFDGSLEEQKFDATYEFSHALSINNGENIEVANCKLQNFRGDGVLFGDTHEPSKNVRITRNINVHDNEFYNIYREGAMFCCTKDGYFRNNYLHGDGFYVGGVDIERHSKNESVTNIMVHTNTFDFREGTGPIGRGKKVSYRRAVTMGFFYEGYENGIVDGESGGHQIYNNTIYQGQIDCFGHTNVSIVMNRILNYFENINGVKYVTADAIHIQDPGYTTGLKNILISSNTIYHPLEGNGIFCYKYDEVNVQSNNIKSTGLPGINILDASGKFDSNQITDIGTIRISPGIVINGKCSPLTITNNIIKETRYGDQKRISFGIQIQSYNAGSIAPRIEFNKSINTLWGVVSEFYTQTGFNIITGNTIQQL